MTASIAELKPKPHKFELIRRQPVYSELELKEFLWSMLSAGYVCGWLSMGGQPNKAIAVVEVFKWVK